MVVSGLWILDYALIAVDSRNAGGFLDCWPACTVLQDFVGVTVFYGGALLRLTIPVSLAALAVAALRRHQPGGPPARPENERHERE